MKNLSFAGVMLAGFLGVFAAACGDDTATPVKDAGSRPTDAGMDSGKTNYLPADSGAPTCTAMTSVVCDGPEDCSGGQRCCAAYTGGYAGYQCADSCSGLEADGGGTWSELCHKGQTCEVEGYSCLVNTSYLPAFLARCRDTGEPVGDQPSTKANEVSCGMTACGAGEHCCLRDPKEPYCAPLAQECTCDDPPPAKDAGTGAGDDAGSDAGG